jgi:hypothetical protein
VDGGVDANSGDEKAEGVGEAPRGGLEGEECVPGAGFGAGEVGEGVLDADLPRLRAEDLHGVRAALEDGARVPQLLDLGVGLEVIEELAGAGLVGTLEREAQVAVEGVRVE